MQKPVTCLKKRDAWWMAVGFLVVLIVGDEVLDRSHLPQVYGSTNGCRWKWELYDQTRPPPDVVFLGCSYGMFGISPTIVDQRVGELTGRSVQSLNLCDSATSAFTQYLLARRIVESHRLPEVVYIGVSPRATVEVAYPWLVNGLRALGDVRDLPMAGSVDRSLLGEGVLTAVFSSYRRWNDCRLIAQRLARGAPIDANSRVRCDSRGWAEWLGSVQPIEDDPALPRPVSADARGPATIEEGNPSRQALRDAIRILSDAGVTVRLFEMPQRTTARGRFHAKDNSAYRAFLQEVVSELQVTVIRPPRGVVADSDFFDTEHLDAGGAAKLSRWLAGDVAAALASSNRQG